MALLQDGMMPGAPTGMQGDPGQQAAPGKPPAPDDQGAPEAPDHAESQAPQEEGAGQQATYNKIVGAAITLLGENKQTSQSAFNILKSGADNPPQAIAAVATWAFKKIDQDSRGTIPLELVIPVLNEIVGITADMGASEKLWKSSDQLKAQALSYTLKSLKDEYGISDQELQEYLASVPDDQKKQAMQLMGGAQPPDQQPQQGQPGQPPQGQPPQGQPMAQGPQNMMGMMGGA